MLTFQEHTHTYMLDGVAVPSVTSVCRYLAYDQKSDRPWLAQAAADRGRRVHEACALLDWGASPEPDPSIDGYVAAYRRFLKDYRPEWQGIEYMTASGSLSLAGTVDRFGALSDGYPCILDLKTGSQLHTASLRAQLTGYRALLAEDRLHFHADRLYALQLMKEGVYRLQEVRPDEGLLNACRYIEQAIRRKSHE